MARRVSSEFRAYPWITDRLSTLGWNTANPNANARGRVWSQGECLLHPEIQKGLGAQKPEFVAKLSETILWVLEAKSHTDEISLASKEAKAYAEAINAGSDYVSARFATGVAGNDSDGYVIRSFYLDAHDVWQSVREGEAVFAQLLSTQDLNRILAADEPDLLAVPITVAEVVEVSKYINSRFHSIGLAKEDRAIIVAILLLALESDPNLLMRDDPDVFITDINTRAKKVFANAGRLPLWETLEIRPSNENIASMAAVLSDVLERIKSQNILHAARRADVLGAFFESFLRHGNSSKDLGIVLTPRHLCWLAAEAVAVSRDDVVYDPTVGTAGFLVAAFNRVSSRASMQAAQAFAIQNLYGIEQSGKVAALAFINMYFRGDGKHNLKIDSSLGYRLVGVQDEPVLKFERGLTSEIGEKPRVSRVLMNPPFGLKDPAQKEIKFVDHGLRQLEKNGLLFSVLPSSVMYDKSFAAWRKSTLEENSLLAVLALPIDIFYPVSTETVCVVFRRGVGHNDSDDVLWAKLTEDGFVKRKGFRVERPGVNYKEFLGPLAKSLQQWIINGVQVGSEDGILEFKPISHGELIPQTHLGTATLVVSEYEIEVKKIFKQMVSQKWEFAFMQEGVEAIETAN